MLRKVTAMSFLFVLVLASAASGFAQGAAKEARVEGRVVRSDKDKSILVVRKGGTAERTVHYDASTKWVSQYHGDAKSTAIEAKDVADGDYVICVGSYDDKKEFQATTISKRLSHPK